MFTFKSSSFTLSASPIFEPIGNLLICIAFFIPLFFVSLLLVTTPSQLMTGIRQTILSALENKSTLDCSVRAFIFTMSLVHKLPENLNKMLIYQRISAGQAILFPWEKTTTQTRNLWTVGESTHQQRYWKTDKSYNWALLRIVIRSERNIIIAKIF